MLLLAVTLASCAKPQPSAYETGDQANTVVSAGIPVGQNTANENCTSQPTPNGAAVYCGSWNEPSANVVIGGAATPSDIVVLAASSPWRASLEGAYQCGAPQATTILKGFPAEALSCTQRFGGWPHVAVVTVINGTVYYGDGVLPALPPLQRAIGVASGTLAADQAGAAAVPTSDEVLAQRLAAQAFSSGDIGQYEALMTLGSQSNQAEDFSAAVIAYRAALSLQQRKLGSDNPATVGPMLELALNLSDLGQYPEAETLFAVAAQRAPLAADPTAGAKLLHYEGLDQLNQTHDALALTLLQQSEAAYAALLPPALLQAQPAGPQNAALFAVSYQAGAGGFDADQTSLNGPVAQAALLGVIETLRYQAIALRAMGESAASQTAIANADRIATANDLAPPILSARLDRTSASLAAASGENPAAISYLQGAASNFSEALPGSRPVAETDLLRARVLRDEHQDSAALAACRDGIGRLTNLQSGTSAALISPCLDVFAAAASAAPTAAAAAQLHGEMFEAAELAQGSVTAREIAEASARLSTSAANPQVAAAIRAEQDANANLAALYNARDSFEAAAKTAAGSTAPTPETLATLDKQIAAATETLKQAELAEQAAAPNFGQLVQQVVSAGDVLKLLHPDEAFLGITSTPDDTWLFLLSGGAIHVARSASNEQDLARLVRAVRSSIEPLPDGTLPSFDMSDASAIYQATMAPFAGEMNRVHALVVAPSGPLLALPFGLLPTASADASGLGDAPWLIRKTTLSYVPAAANFVSLRKIQGTSAATQPWFGFGDFQPVTLAQAQATYSGAACGESALAFANLPSLPYARLELQAASAIFGANPNDELLGAAFTVPNIEAANLKDFRILHFATHALLPTDLPCQNQPAIVASAPPDASSASDALLTTSDVTNLKLDADLVILSACNTGGGAQGGEALSGLARSFFYAGARALMVTQWSVNDRVSAYLVADTLSRLHAGADGGAAGSLQAAQLGIIDGAGHGLPSAVANPFYWAAFAVIGDGGSSGHAQLSALAGAAGAGL
jgi:CHAT domain-containing protein